MYVNALTVLASMALVKTMGCKRFGKAVSKHEPVPPSLLGNLKETMQMAKDLGLSVPADLQAKALKFISKGDQ